MHVEEPLPAFLGKLKKGLQSNLPGVVHQNIESAEAANHRGDQPVALLLAADISETEVGFSPLLANSGDNRGRFLLACAMDHNSRAFAREPHGDRLSNAAR